MRTRDFASTHDRRGTCFILVTLVAIAPACSGTIVPRGGTDSSGSGVNEQSGSGSTTGASNKQAGSGAAGAPGANAQGSCSAQTIATRVWRLSPLQMQNTMASAFAATGVDMSGAPGDAVSQKTGFTNSSTDDYMSDQLSQVLVTQAEAAATKFASQVTTTYSCLGAASITDACVSDFVSKMGRKIFRRPLTTNEASTYVPLFRDRLKAGDVKSASKVVAMTLVLSPSFVYRTELGDGSGVLNQYEIASAISYGLTDGPPDDTLMAAADANQLGDSTARAGHARRLLATQGAKDKFADFAYWQLQMFKLDLLQGQLSSDTITSLESETKAFASDILGSTTPTLTALYTSSSSFVNATLAPIYGVQQTSKTLVKTPLPAQQRFGYFTEAGWLSAVQGPIHRGKLIKNLFLCQDVPPPPNTNVADLQKQLPVVPADATEHDKWIAFMADNKTCASCHQFFQPLGLALDNYDATGKYRTTNDAGKAIDPSGQIPDAVGWSGKFSDANDLIHQIAASSSGQSCFAQRYLTYLFGTSIDGADVSCLTQAVSKTFADKGLDLRELMAAAVSSDAFVNRSQP